MAKNATRTFFYHLDQKPPPNPLPPRPLAKNLYPRMIDRKYSHAMFILFAYTYVNNIIFISDTESDVHHSKATTLDHPTSMLMPLSILENEVLS